MCCQDEERRNNVFWVGDRFENVHMAQADKVIASKCVHAQVCVCVWRGVCMCGIE